MKSSTFFTLLFLFSLTPAFVHAQPAAKPFQLTDLRKLVEISSPQISPDGAEVAFIASRADWKKDERIPEIELVDVTTGSMRALTYDRMDISHLRWSPNGKSLGFIAKDPQSGKSQIFIMPMDGGDAVRITDSKTGIAEFSWSPNGKNIAYVAQDTVPNPEAVKHHEDAFTVSENDYLKRAPVQPWHIWLVSSTGGTPQRLTDGSWSLNTDEGTMTPLAWNPDGRAITFARFPDVWYGNVWGSTIAQVSIPGGAVRTVVSDTASLNPGYAPGSGTLAFLRPKDGDLNNGNTVYIDRNGKISDVARALDRNINHYAWLPGGKTLLLTGEKGTKSVIWLQPVDGRAQELNTGDVEPAGILSVSDNGSIAFAGNTPSHPSELYLMKSYDAIPKRLTDLNNFVDSLDLSRAQTINWNGPDGFKEDGVLNYPLKYEKGKKFPMVLVIHGGPEGASTLRFSPLVQLLAAKGFFVFQPNYRGSINLGNAYQHAIYRNTGKGPGEDVMAGLAEIERTGMIDTKRIGISGWSYGGYMTSWLNGFYPEKWKAAVEGAALNDWVMDYTISFYQRGDVYFFGGSPWSPKYWKIWRDQSPIILAPRVKAPTLIMGDAGDANVPIVNSYEMFHALRDNGVHTEFYVYPADTHFPRDIVRTTDVYRRWIDWMVKYLK